MRVTRLDLVQFRNLNTRLALSDRINVFYGANGQGKTNVLEAVHVACYGRSFRLGRLADLIRFDQEWARVEAVVLSEGVETPVTVVLADNQRRHQVAGKENCSLVEVGEVLRVIFFGPEDLDLVKGGPSVRRDFLDRAIVVHHPPYGPVLRSYARLMRERNQLLRDLERGRLPAMEVIESYEEELARRGAQMLSFRKKYLAGFLPLATKLVDRHTDSRLRLEMRYASGLDLEGRIETKEIYPLLRRRLMEERDEDTAAGRTLVGPHADDLEIDLNGRPARYFASQGEQRQVAVSLKLAQLGLWKERFGVSPVLLLDDVLSELDPERQRLLFERVQSWGVQTFLTTTTRPDMLSGEEHRFFHVEAGQVRQEA